MKLLKIVGSVVALSLGLTGVSAAANSYFPPERIHCTKATASKIRCEGFSHTYLTEDMASAHFDKKEDTFYFVSGVAYFTPDMKEATVSFTYKNSEHNKMKLKTTSILLHPDLSNTTSSWNKVQDDLYTCDAGYMNCPIKDTSVDDLK